MPIKPENKKLYPSNWKEISEYIRFVRADNKCEECGVPNHAVGYRDDKGKFNPVCGNIYLDCYGQGLTYPSLHILPYKLAKSVADNCDTHCITGKHYIVIVLTVAHLDHNPQNNDYSNLKSMCQKCHNNYDKEHRVANRKHSSA